MDGDKIMALRFAGVCAVCGVEIEQRTRAIYNAIARNVRHLDCDGELDRGSAGASAKREFDRRSVKDAATIEQQKANVAATFGTGVIGKIATFLAVDDRPRTSTMVWAQGAVGEERVAQALDPLAEVGVVSLHDRRIPKTMRSIDHIAVTPWGVWVIDAKHYPGKRPDMRTEGGFFGVGGHDHLTVDGRTNDKLIAGALSQRDLVAAVVGDGVPVSAALVFVDAEWPLLGGEFSVNGVRVLWPKRLPKLLLRTEEPTLAAEPLARRIAAAFPAA